MSISIKIHGVKKVMKQLVEIAQNISLDDYVGEALDNTLLKMQPKPNKQIWHECESCDGSPFAAGLCSECNGEGGWWIDLEINYDK